MTAPPDKAIAPWPAQATPPPFAPPAAAPILERPILIHCLSAFVGLFLFLPIEYLQQFNEGRRERLDFQIQPSAQNPTIVFRNDQPAEGAGSFFFVKFCHIQRLSIGPQGRNPPAREWFPIAVASRSMGAAQRLAGYRRSSCSGSNANRALSGPLTVSPRVRMTCGRESACRIKPTFFPPHFGTDEKRHQVIMHRP